MSRILTVLLVMFIAECVAIGSLIAADGPSLSKGDTAILVAAMEFLSTDERTLKGAEVHRQVEGSDNVLLRDRTLSSIRLAGMLEEAGFDLSTRTASSEALTVEQWAALEIAVQKNRSAVAIELKRIFNHWHTVDDKLFDEAPVDKEPFWGRIRTEFPRTSLVVRLSAPAMSANENVAFVEAVVTGTHGYSRGQLLFLRRSGEHWSVEKAVHTWVE